MGLLTFFVSGSKPALYSVAVRVELLQALVCRRLSGVSMLGEN